MCSGSEFNLKVAKDCLYVSCHSLYTQFTSVLQLLWLPRRGHHERMPLIGFYFYYLFIFAIQATGESPTNKILLENYFFKKVKFGKIIHPISLPRNLMVSKGY